jgi:hypothetical protein
VTTGTEALLASGSLAETPFAHLMLYLYRQAGTGTLFVRSGGGAEVVVHVEGGRPDAARSTEGGTDMMQTLLPACGFTTGEFAFYSGDHINAVQEALEKTEIIEGQLDPYALLYASLRDHARDDMADGVLARYPTAKLMVPADRDVARLGLDDHDQAVVDALRAKPMSVDEIIMSSPLPGLHTRRLIYALLVTHMLAPDEARATDLYKSQVDGDAVIDVVPPPATPSQRAAVDPRRTGERSIPPTVPDKPAPPRVIVQKPAVAGSVNDVASASMPAWQRLMSMRPVAPVDPKRTTLDGSLRPPAAARSSLAGVNANDPAMKRRRADQFLQTGKFTDALALLDELLAAEPKDAKLHGLRARALFEVHKADSDGLPRTVLEAVRKAHELDPDEANAYFVRGLIFKQGGETHKAIACWRRALHTDPKHLDAQREIRISQMRKQ